MEGSQFEEVKSEIDLIQTNTSWTWYNNVELEKLNEKMEVMLSVLDENNELLRELICVIRNQNCR
ncbi:hypothetical protein [Mucilaginibacter sp. FT3.2]|uniref:hypothetical protein n=1 Tax=Mucilaginibacter sp. FT3.2 TaxID=2723090 RepID=UPI001618AA51|nr:hypothetical protein [Mucilaginibacter sp. FT3.2]MBB6233658.1 hypothetical protein [Mucilaginibacter sp. FT3.2]